MIKQHIVVDSLTADKSYNADHSADVALRLVESELEDGHRDSHVLDAWNVEKLVQFIYLSIKRAISSERCV